jgi:3-oxoacyl-[acyl-carrier protein] reductase
MDRPLKDRVALVTGSGNGIGKATALRLARLGATVAINDLKPELVEAAVAEVERSGGTAIPVVRNISTRDGMWEAVRETKLAGGRLDILVNNAAWVRYQAVPDIAQETLDRMLAVGFSGVIWGVQAAVDAMDAERGGAIVNVASSAGIRAAANSVVYSGIKAGVMGVTRAAAAELGRRRIRVNAVAPSAIPTEGTMRNRNAERDAMRVARTPLGRLGTVDDVAKAICFLASDAAEFISGEVLLVDGGVTLSNL